LTQSGVLTSLRRLFAENHGQERNGDFSLTVDGIIVAARSVEMM